ncbi:dihydrolipoamide acetyltransferase family protein [Oligoflexus tunisiensis]|uniref:dihydrolipoamide acetyltransferase family protein n=1 Tax=Oligoflexus tunisiensis TaxID=708132 RepID=UPI000A58AA25|nr:dihydrolipoamide acetyltransferase family protein [Oligoflexus tunisiensis]
MAEVIEMPKLSDTMEEGGIAAWLKKEGDFVKEGEAFVEIETDKATMEYNSPVEGTLLKILVPAGKATALNEPICVIGEKGESFDLGKLGGKAQKEPAKAEAPKTAAAAAPAPARGPAPAPAKAPAPPAGERFRASPLAKKVAEEKRIDLHQLQGTGPNGRVVIRDVEQALAGGGAALKLATPAKEITTPVQPIPLPQIGDQDIPVNMMRKTIAKRLLAGKNEAPHFYLTRSVNMSRLNAWRQRLNAEAEAQKQPKVSVTDLLILAVSRALMKHPEVNSSWQGDFIRRYGAAHVAVAVAIPDGLITPVVRNANQLGARDIAQITKDLIGRAKSGSLKPDEYQNGTFSISNLGMMGIEHFTAIINPPQAAILAVGATVPTPWVNEAGAVEVQPRMTMTMSCDHRVVDGAVGATFLQTLASYLEDPLLILS